ncbi:MAG: CPBP family intramembrane metalloprotease [Pirellulales bacterium]|nr:CPBP family intramembrane metalloprotease [Pirellulales bacterium]
MSNMPEMQGDLPSEPRRGQETRAERAETRGERGDEGGRGGVFCYAETAAVVTAVLFPVLITWVYFIALAGAAPGLQQAAYGLGKSLQFALPILWVAIFRRQRLVLRGPQRAGLLDGLAFGLVVFAAALLLYHLWLKPSGYLVPAAGVVRDKIAAFYVDSLWKYAAMGVFYCVIHAFLEEYYWRWFVFDELRRLLPVAAAIAVSALGFTLHHILVLGFYFGWFSIATWFFSLAVAVGGAFWAWLYHRSGSLYGPWLSHLLIDAAIFAVGYDMVKGWLAT